MLKIPKWVLISFICLSFAGFLDASYLTVKHYTQGIVPCYFFESCQQVTTSKYSVVAGIPVSLAGALYYLTILIVSILFLDTENKKLFQFLGYRPTLGLIASSYFLYIQAVILKEFCSYCVLSAIFSIILFVLSLKMLGLQRNSKRP